MEIVNVSGYLLLKKNGKEFYKWFQTYFQLHFMNMKQYKVLGFNLGREGSFKYPSTLQQSNVWNDRFLHGGLANATSSSWHEVSKWQCVQPSYGVTKTWCKD